eukprot:876131-Amphidinium_carterae.2
MALDSQRERRTAHPGRRELFALAKVLGGDFCTKGLRVTLEGLSEPFTPANCARTRASPMMLKTGRLV